MNTKEGKVNLRDFRREFEILREMELSNKEWIERSKAFALMRIAESLSRIVEYIADDEKRKETERMRKEV